MDELVERAKFFALNAHRGQTRFNKARTPLSDHLEEVASLVAESGGNDVELAAAWLHDTLGDTSVTLDDIMSNFGPAVAGIVYGLTDLPEFSKLHTRERKTAQAKRILSLSNSILSNSVKRVKIADQTSNVKDVAFDPPVNWDDKKRLDYALGAAEVVLACWPIRGILAQKFIDAYIAVLKSVREKEE